MTADRPNVNGSSIYSVGQAAKALGVHRNTINRYLADGKIPYSINRITGRKAIKGQDIVDAWLNVF